jgi:peptidoglycan/xylan/chitin deacetylase (PgdA/CDA1 family)
VAGWPGGARGALCLSFDNLGEAAAIELGAVAPDDPGIGEHPTVTRTLPSLLEALAEHELAATFFVEGLNAELYPEALKEIAARGHEVAYHAWRHEQWGELPAAEQADNLARGIAAFEALGLRVAGMRPPGGELGAGGLDVMREAGLTYCSPAGDSSPIGGASPIGASTGEARVEDGIAMLPFRWRHVDASCVLPDLSAAREEISGSPDPVEPAAFLAYQEREIDRLVRDGGFATFIFHPFMLEWLGRDRLERLLDRLAVAASESGLWVATAAEVAAHLLSHQRGWGDRPSSKRAGPLSG